MSEDHLTKPHDTRINQLIAATPLGMAHWSGTGPDGTRCSSCDHARFNGYHPKQHGGLKPITCAQFYRMQGRKPAFSADVKSCRFYVPGDGPPKKHA